MRLFVDMSAKTMNSFPAESRAKEISSTKDEKVKRADLNHDELEGLAIDFNPDGILLICF